MKHVAVPSRKTDAPPMTPHILVAPLPTARMADDALEVLETFFANHGRARACLIEIRDIAALARHSKH